MPKTERLYAIERMIRNRGHVSFRALREALEVSPATLKRDLEFLRDRLGAPIEYDRDVNGYRFAAQSVGDAYELPGLWFNEQELYALLMAHQLLSGIDRDGVISRHLQPLLDRIHQLLGDDPGGAEPARAQALMQRVRLITPAERPVAPAAFERVAQALMRRRRLAMRYATRGRGGSVGEREVSPQRLVHYRHTWYLDAWCHSRQRLSRFALDAIETAQPLADVPALEMPIEQVQAQMDAGYGIYAGATPRWATLRFDADAARWVSREQWHAAQRARWLDDGRYELQVPYADETELAMDVLRHGEQVEVVAPPELRRAVAQRLRRAAARYDGDALDALAMAGAVATVATVDGADTADATGAADAADPTGAADAAVPAHVTAAARTPAR